MTQGIVVKPTKQEVWGNSLWLIALVGFMVIPDVLRDRELTPDLLIWPLFILCFALPQFLKRVEVNEDGIWLCSWRGTQRVLWNQAARGTLHWQTLGDGNWLSSAWNHSTHDLPVTLILFDANNEVLLNTTVDFGTKEDRRTFRDFVAARLHVDNASTRMTQQVFADRKRTQKIGYGYAALAISLVLMWACFAIRGSRATDIRGAHFTDAKTLATAQGIVTSSQLRETRGNGQRWNYPQIWYQFQTAGRTYQSRQVTFSCTGGGGADYAEEFVKKYPTGKAITVFYDPKDPSFSVLEPHIADNFLGVLVLFVLAALGALSSLLYLLRQYANPAQSNAQVLATS